ncbi:hypothetical protein AABB24_004359 [Solanum stoloniferum]|uniref:Uncharacterized protein n=1 Tax=Solanum stoloniferum TaxID=62892 RepID=A0ABD2VCG0_9SOLN
MLVSSQQQNSFPQYQPMQMHIRPDYSQFQYMQPQPGMMASHMYTASASGSRDSIATGHDNLSGSAHMEDFKFNLMSVSQMTKDLDCCVTFYPHCCVIQDLSSGMVRKIGKKEKGLYTMYSQVGNKGGRL